MIQVWQAVVLFLGIGLTAVTADEKAFDWKPPEVGPGVFSDALGLLDREREEYATNLSIHAVNGVAAAKASTHSLAEARKLIALALHLSPRNKRALVSNFQLKRGIVPASVTAEYSPEVFAQLLYTRGQILRQQGGEENLLLARVFTDMAAEMDPKNEEAVYASELQRIEQGAIDWSELTDVGPAPKNNGSDD